jgi:hypothetical protein
MKWIEILQRVPEALDVLRSKNRANIEVSRDDSRAMENSGKAPYHHKIHAGIS